MLDRRRGAYRSLKYWLRLIVRYYIASAALSYGIIKLFALQMLFPTTSQLATPLGEMLPMRFSWLFIGYAMPYQIFSGIMETVAGLLLLYRRTVTAGLLVATAPRGPIALGVYDVVRFVVNGAEQPTTSADSIRWKDVIFDTNGVGSINTRDTLFQQRYRRGYFRFTPDTAARTGAVWKRRLKSFPGTAHLCSPCATKCPIRAPSACAR